MNDSFFDHVGEHPCTNCESAPAAYGDLFCNPDCRAEYEGEDDDDTPITVRGHWGSNGGWWEPTPVRVPYAVRLTKSARYDDSVFPS